MKKSTLAALFVMPFSTTMYLLNFLLFLLTFIGRFPICTTVLYHAKRIISREKRTIYFDIIRLLFLLKIKARGAVQPHKLHPSKKDLLLVYRDIFILSNVRSAFCIFIFVPIFLRILLRNLRMVK